jgi:hypothetical protein
MCGEYYEKIIEASAFKNGLEIALTLFNTILRYFVIYAVTWVGYHT